jgi:hypothetical protein
MSKRLAPSDWLLIVLIGVPFLFWATVQVWSYEFNALADALNEASPGVRCLIVILVIVLCMGSKRSK